MVGKFKNTFRYQNDIKTLCNEVFNIYTKVQVPSILFHQSWPKWGINKTIFMIKCTDTSVHDCINTITDTQQELFVLSLKQTTNKNYALA